MLTIKAPNRQKTASDSLDREAEKEGDAIWRLKSFQLQLPRIYKRPTSVQASVIRRVILKDKGKSDD